MAEQKANSRGNEAHRFNLADAGTVRSIYWLHASSLHPGNTGVPGSDGNGASARTDCERDAIGAAWTLSGSATTILKSYAEQNPNQAEAYEALGQLYYHFGYYAAAEPAFEKAIDLAPNDRAARILAAVCLFKIGETQKAEAATRKLLAENPPPNDVDLSLTYARYLYENHDLDGALAQAKAAERSEQLAPQLPYARNLLVRLYRLQGRNDEVAREAEWLKSFEGQKANP